MLIFFCLEKILDNIGFFLCINLINMVFVVCVIWKIMKRKFWVVIKGVKKYVDFKVINIV